MKRNRGAVAIEYLLIISVVIVLFYKAFYSFGQKVHDKYKQAGKAVSEISVSKRAR